jgi:limonene-1,2-epoxide hydrolase
MSDNAAIINNFMQAWNNMDVDAVMQHFTEDAAYANIPMGPPHVGKAAIREFIDGFMGGASEISFIVHNQVAQGDVVMNERTDRLVLDGKTVELPVMGVFEMREGLIAGWRDYFDMGGFA